MERRMKGKIHGVTLGEDQGEHRQENVKTLLSGQQIFGKREEDNPFDSSAIKLYADEACTLPLGYVPREIAKIIVEQSKFGWTYAYEVTEVTGGSPGKPSRGCNIDVIARKDD